MYSKESINTSAEAIHPRQNKVAIVPQQAEQVKLYQKQKRRARNQGLSHLYHQDYKPAVYKKALQFRDSMSYKKKINQNTYKQIQLFEDTNELKIFGLGPYFFVEYQRRIIWLFFIFSILEALRIYINVQGTGLADYKGSFGTYLVITTLGNFNGNVLTQGDIYILSIIPIICYLFLFIFYMWWKCSYSAAISEQDNSKQFVKPEKFCVEVEGFDENDNVKEEELEELFSAFGPVYEVSLAREYSGNLKYFEELDELEEEIKEEELQIILGSGNQETLKKLRKEKEELSKYINTLRIKPSVRSAFIHFQFEKSKVDMLDFYSNHYLFSESNSHALTRAICCCCVDDPAPKYLYKGKPLFVKSMKVPQPEDINWDSYEVGTCGKIVRILFSAFIIILFLAISCTIIGLCSVYISSHSVSCKDYDIPNTIAQAQATITNSIQKKCYCNANLLSSLSNSEIKKFCGNLLNQVYTEQGIQYAITMTSSVVNFLFSLIVHKLVSLTQPYSHSTGYFWKTIILSIFLIFNTVFLPLLIYANIFGFEATHYVSFITMISTDIRNFFKIDSIKFSQDFEVIWYRNVAPIFINYIILDTILTWVFYILFKCCCGKQNLESKEGTILQKTMNEKIVSWKLNVADQYANFNLIIFLAMFYDCGIPVLVPLAFVNLTSKYITNRSLLQTLSSKVEGLSQGFNALPLGLLPIMLVLSCLVGQWMLTGNDLIGAFTKMQIHLGIKWQILQRELLLPFYIILALVIIFQFLFYNIIVRFCSWLAESCYDRKQVVHPYYTRQYSYYTKTMSIMYSYNIRNNIKYKNVIFNLQKYLQGQELKM